MRFGAVWLDQSATTNHQRVFASARCAVWPEKVSSLHSGLVHFHFVVALPRVVPAGRSLKKMTSSALWHFGHLIVAISPGCISGNMSLSGNGRVMHHLRVEAAVSAWIATQYCIRQVVHSI